MIIPLSVPNDMRAAFERNWQTITRGSNRLFLFAGDQKIEHLNEDFYGDDIPDICNNPTHLFTIASKAPIGCFATHLGLIARHGKEFASIPYLVKLNGKTSIAGGEPRSALLHTVDDVVTFAQHSNLNIPAVGLTVYLGSEHEADMLQQAAQQIWRAHQHGLVTVLWMYPRGGNVDDHRDANLIAGAAGVGHALGADFVKVSMPNGESPAEYGQSLRQAVGAAGNTGVICAGGSRLAADKFITHVKAQLSIASTRGVAAGRNIYQRSQKEAIELCEQLSELIYST
ncbi:MAG: aldolase [Candidatus Dependentiae bacterium]|jgi:fructose-bisphosphate aldolase/6-deoxy-5-ketofructose 1-phosphate synthase